MKKILITYSCSLSVGPSLLAALEMQKQFPLAENIQQLVFSDLEIPGVNIPMILDARLMRPDGYAHGLARNLNIAAARARDVDYLVMLEADSVFLGFKGGAPASDYETLLIFFQDHPGEAFTHSGFLEEKRWRLASWMVLGRKLFMEPWCSSDERFVGWGWEDFDFVQNVMAPRGFHLRPSSGSAIHLWHPWRCEPERRNEKLFNAKLAGLNKA